MFISSENQIANEASRNTPLSVYMVLYESQCNFQDTSTYTHMHTGMHACNGTCSFPFSVTTTMCTLHVACILHITGAITCMSCTQLNQLRHSHVLQSAKILKQSSCYPYTPSSVSQTMQPVENTKIIHLHQKSRTSFLPVMNMRKCLAWRKRSLL